MNRQELEEINDQLQVQLGNLQEQLKSAPSPQVETDNRFLREENETLHSEMEELEAERQRLSEALTQMQLNRQNELLQLQSERAALEDRRQIELSRLGEEARNLAEEREAFMQERMEVEQEVSRALAAERKALASEEGWKKQATFAAEKMREAQNQVSQSLIKQQDLTGEINSTVRLIKELEARQPMPLWWEMAMDLSDHPWIILLIMLLLMVGYLIVSTVSWIWSWLAS